MVRLINLRQKLFTYPHHLRIEIPNPVHLDRLVRERRLTTHLIIADDHGAFHTFALMLRHHAKDQPKHLVGRGEGLVPKELQLSDQVHLTIHVLEDLVDLRDLDEKAHRLSLMKSKVNQALVDDRAHLTKHHLSFLQRYGLAHMPRPSLVVYGHKVLRR